MLNALILLSAIGLGAVANAKEEKKDTSCDQIDPAKKFPDGIPYCPEIVKQNAYAVTRCAFSQAKEWHAAKADEKKKMKDLIYALRDWNAPVVLAKADALKLQVCRSQKDQDSFLLMYTKPRVRDYSGPFLMFREGSMTSGIVIESPHDGQDGTNRSTRAAFQDSNAQFLLSNGHPRKMAGRDSDWAHTKKDLGWYAFAAIKQFFPESIHLHVHGVSQNRVMVTDSVGWKSPHVLRSAFIDAAKKSLPKKGDFAVTAWRFNGWTTGLAMTQNERGKGRKDNERWVGMEVSVRLHKNTNFLSKAVRILEDEYIHKGRPLAVEPPQEVEPDPEDTVDDQEIEQGNEPEEEELPLPPKEVVPEIPSQDETLEIDDGEQENDVDEADLEPEVKHAKRPPMRPLKGNRRLLCIGIEYTDLTVAGKDGCLALAEYLEEYWARNSRGLLRIKPFSEEPFKLGLPGNARNYDKAVDAIKAKYPNYQYYVVPGKFTHPHASKKVAQVKSTQKMTATHEVGHLLGLGHAGAYGKDGFNPYGDNESIMGRLMTKYINAPQYYYLGWLKPEEIVDYDPAVSMYQLKLIADWKGGGVQTIIVPPKDGEGRYGFLSATRCGKKPCVSLHLATKGGTQKVFETGDEATDRRFSGIHVKIVQHLPRNRVKFQVDIQPLALPIPNK